MATHSIILAWITPWTAEPVGCSPCVRKESDTAGQLTLSLFFTRALQGLMSTWYIFSIPFTFSLFLSFYI